MNKLLLALFSILLISATYAHTHDAQCGHGKRPLEPELLNVEEDLLFKQAGRHLAAATYPQIRINADYSLLTNGSASFISYVKKDLLPPVIDYFESAIQVKAPLTSALKFSSTVTSICGGTVPSGLRVGTITDHYVIVGSDWDEENWVASAASCYLSTTTKRPLISRMLFNMVYTAAADGDILTHEKNMYLTMHEMVHALGFSSSSFTNFIDANGNTLTNHIKSVNLNGSVRTVLVVEPLVTKLRTHFGCSTLLGAFMEQDGGAGTAGSHFERRHFLYETMTSGVIHGRRISEFTFAVLEGSGWYVANYSFAEPFYWGQGEGCNFLYQNCTSTGPDFSEFCYATTKKCTAVGRSGGVCTSDTRTDGCQYSFPMIDYDCENEEAVDNARLPTWESYGRTAGSKCFEGNLTTLVKSTATTYCFKYQCSGTGLNTKLYVTAGTRNITCSAEGQVAVSGLNGRLNCPDPLTFCNTVGKKFCPRNCMGRGTCNTSTGICKCQTGYSGVDCALNA